MLRVHDNLTLPAMLVMLGLLLFPDMAISNEQLPIYIESDSLTVDDAKGIGHYTGHVKLSQGTLLIKADDVKVYMKDNKLEKMIIIGDPAHLNQQPKQQHPVTAEAKRIEYLADSDIIKLYGDAQVRQGTQDITGEFIQYNRRTSLINANGNRNKKDRVNITITPQKESTSP